MEILVRLVICQEGIKLFGLISFSLPNLRESTNTVDIFIQPLSNHIQMCQLLDFFFFLFYLFSLLCCWESFHIMGRGYSNNLGHRKRKKKGGMEKKRERNIGEIAEVSCFLAFSFSQDLQMWHCFQSLSSQVILPKEEEKKGRCMYTWLLAKNVWFSFVNSVRCKITLPFDPSSFF